MKIIPKALLLSSAALIIGCSSSTENTSDTEITSQNDQIDQLTDEVKAIYPNFQILEPAPLCQKSSSNPLVGCYVSEVCAENDSNSTSRLFITDFGSDGIIRSTYYMFMNSSCSGSVIPVGLSALNMEYQVGNEVLSESGVIVMELDSTRSIEVLETTFTTDYFSSFHLESNRLCLPDFDYDWETTEAGLSFSQEIEESRLTNIDFDNCLVRIYK